MRRNVQVKHRGSVQVDGVKAQTGTVDDLQSLTFFHTEVNQQRFVLEVGERLDWTERYITVSFLLNTYMIYDY